MPKDSFLQGGNMTWVVQADKGILTGGFPLRPQARKGVDYCVGRHADFCTRREVGV